MVHILHFLLFFSLSFLHKCCQLSSDIIKVGRSSLVTTVTALENFPAPPPPPVPFRRDNTLKRSSAETAQV